MKSYSFYLFVMMLVVIKSFTILGVPSFSRPFRTSSNHLSLLPKPQLPILFTNRYGKDITIKAELALTSKDIQQGLMWRTELAADSGMLFVFPREEAHAMWMKNTLIPLDMVFISEDKRIVGIVNDAQPYALTTHAVSFPSRYVLEVPGGWCKKNGIAAGDPIVF